MTATQASSDAPSSRTRPLVVVTVGSDHHPFGRLVEWVDAWSEANPAVDCYIQYGTAKPPRRARGDDYVPHGELQSMLAAADVVVVQGGPMSIVEAQRLGKRPIVVPRTAALGEVVDDHQHAFCNRLAEQGRVRLATDVESLSLAIKEALTDPQIASMPWDPSHAAAVTRAVDSVAEVAREVLHRPAAYPSVLFIGGFGRSGTTLLERMLGQAPGVTALGEVLHLWERGLQDDDLCGCGEPFSRCPFWQAVGERAYGGWGAVPPANAVADREAVVSNRRVPALIVPIQSTARRLRRDRLLRRLDLLYGAAADISGARLLVDSSKHPAYAFLLRRSRRNLRCLLMVRDPRGVAWSWSKTVVRPEVRATETLMPTYGLLGSAMRWSVYGLLFHLLSRLGVPVLVVRYEDLISDPQGTLRRIFSFADIEPSEADLAHITGSDVVLSVNHTVAGNPMRFRTGRLSLRLDEAWRTSMSATHQFIVGTATIVQRAAYGYLRDSAANDPSDGSARQMPRPR